MKKLSINNFTTKHLSTYLLNIKITKKFTKKFGSKVINRQPFHRKTVFHMKILSIINFTTKLLRPYLSTQIFRLEQKSRALVSKTTFEMDPNRKITKKLTNKFDSKVINRQYFHRKTGLQGQKKNSTTAVQHSDRKKIFVSFQQLILYFFSTY